MKYHIDPEEIGRGHYGVVRKCMDRETKVWYAIKSIRKSKVGKIEVLKREIALLKEVDHPNIIRLVEAHEDEKYLHLITELCTGGELFDRIIAKTQSDEGHFSEADAAKIVRCILDAIRYCHDVKGIVHRDLKPENFLFSTPEEDAVIKIIDFGLSRHDDMKMGIMNTKVGTPYYVAPERSLPSSARETSSASSALKRRDFICCISVAFRERRLSTSDFAPLSALTSSSAAARSALASIKASDLAAICARSAWESLAADSRNAANSPINTAFVSASFSTFIFARKLSAARSVAETSAS